MTDEPTRVLLVDDQELVRSGLRRILRRKDGFEVVAECVDGSEVEDAVRRSRPDVVVMDLRMRDVDGIEAPRRLTLRPDSPPVLVLTTFDDQDDVTEAIAAGANGYLLKDIDADELRDAVRRAAAGEPQVAPGIMRQMMDRIARLPTRRSTQAELAGLTDREVEILTHVGRGLSNEEIGKALFLSPETARTYVSRLMTKLDARDRAQLVVLAHRAGLVD